MRKVVTLPFVLAILAIGLVPLPTAHADERAPDVPSIRFFVSPKNAVVYQGTMDGNFHAIGVQGTKLNIEVDTKALKRGRKVIFRFSVPQWFKGEYPNWGQLEKGRPKDDIDLTAFQLIASNDDLVKPQIPANGTPFQLPLPFSVAFQAWTLAHPVLSVLSLLLTAGLLFVATKWRTLLSKLDLRQPGPDASVVGEYKLQQKIGEGGMGEVWAATSASSLKCALKFIRKELADDPDFKKRFEREIRACLPLKHPHLLQLYGYGVAADGRMYTVSELLEGDTLKQLIRQGTFDPPQLAAKVVEQVGDALHYLHCKGLVHRDIKPDNIFVCNDGSLKLMDMGLIQGEGYTVVTQTGAMMGTPAYMPPEQMGSKASPASDQYSLGIVLYEILAGQRPFIQPDAIMLAYQHMHAAPAPPSELQPRIVPEVEQAILRMLEKSPKNRFDNLKKVQLALEPLGYTSWVDTSEETQQSKLKNIPPRT